MSAKRLPKDCPECGETFQPSHARQVCCSRSCAAARSWKRSEARRTAWWKSSIQTRKPRNLAALKALLAGCQTLGDAYRLGFTRGYQQGWQTGKRRDDMRRTA